VHVARTENEKHVIFVGKSRVMIWLEKSWHGWV